MKYKFWLCLFGENYTSDIYNNAVDCLEDFCKQIKTNENCYWGQFIEIYEDGTSEVKLALEGLFKKK